MDRLKRPLDLFVTLWALAGAVVLVVLVQAPPWSIGEGRFDAFVARLEAYDFKRIVLAGSFVAWVVPLAIVLVWRQVRAVGFENTRLRSAFEPLLRPVPMQVQVEGRIPVRIEEPLVVPVEVAARIPIDEEIEIEGEIPVRLEIPIETEVETTVMRFGTIRVPVRANIPVDLVLPVKGRVRARASVPVVLNESARVQLPPFEVPIGSSVATKIDLVANLRRRDGAA